MVDFQDLRTFAAAQKDACDIDPLYPVLKDLFNGWYEMDFQKAWAVLVYVAFYNAPSALVYLDANEPIEMTTLPTGVERRGLRGGRAMHEHLGALREEANHGILSWLKRGWTEDPQANWRATRATLEEVKGNGRWASYKTAEVLQKVLGWNLEPPDMGMDRASGPRDGLDLLFGDHASTKVCEARGRALQRLLDLDLDIAEVETVLCDFHSMARGHYYVGHDVALLHDDIEKMPHGTARKALEAAATCLPDAYWRPRDKALGKVYRDTGRIVTA